LVEHRRVLIAREEIRHHIARRADAERLIKLRIDSADAPGPERVAPLGAEAVDVARGDLGGDEILAATLEIVGELEPATPEHRSPRLVDRNDLEPFLAVAVDDVVVDLLIVSASVDFADVMLELLDVERLSDRGLQRLRDVFASFRVRFVDVEKRDERRI